MRTNLRQLQSSLETISCELNKQQRCVQKTIDNTTFVHKCVKVKPRFTKPKDAHAYPEMQTIYDKVQDGLTTLAQAYQRISTNLILQGQQGTVFQFRMDRIHTLSHTLIDKIACFHAHNHRNRHKHLHTLDPSYELPSKETLATLALHRLYESSPEQLLSYLDITQDKLLKLFEQLYPQSQLKNYESLNTLDQQTVQHTQSLITQYIGTITWIPHNARITEEITKNADEATRLAMEQKAAREASQATKKAL